LNEQIPLFFPRAVLSRDSRHGATSKGKALLITLFGLRGPHPLMLPGRPAARPRPPAGAGEMLNLKL
jgi:hypothetical protein